MSERMYIMRKKGICFGLILALLLPFVFTTEVKASDNTELNIYALYLNSEKKGDSTLLESKGHYLLIDIGADNHAPAIIKQLQTLGVTHVDVMFSHLHTDHTGGCSTDLQAGLKQFALSGITIDTLYLPDPSLAVLSRSYPSRYAAFQAFMSTQGTGRIVYLNVGDQVNVGDATGKVIGPVNTNEISPYAYTSITKEKERFILEAVPPSYAFIPNTGVSETDAKTNKWRTGTAIKRMTSYGLCYLVGNEEKTLIFHIENDKITLYRGDTVETGKKMTGWQSLYGADGLYRDHDMYYFDKNGSLSTGVKMIGKHYYYFRKGGQMDYGTYNSEGNYSGWHSYNGKKRYFRLSDDENYAYMDVGRKKIGSETYYFDKNGYKLIPDIVGDDENVEDDIYPTQIGSDYYYLNEDGAMTEDDWINIDGEDYFFGKNGKMYRNGVYAIAGDNYLFESDGTLAVGDSHTELYDFKNSTYAVRADGTLVSGKIAKIDGYQYYFNSKGKLQSNKIIHVGKHNYYFGKNGVLIKNKKIKRNGKIYYSNKNGVLSNKK